MEVVNVQAIQNLSKSKSKSSSEADSKLFNDILTDATKTTEVDESSKKEESKSSNKLLEMMMGILNVNIHQDNAIGSNLVGNVLADENLVDLDTLPKTSEMTNTSLDNMMISMKDMTNNTEAENILDLSEYLTFEIPKEELSIIENNQLTSEESLNVVNTEVSLDVDATPKSLKDELLDTRLTDAALDNLPKEFSTADRIQSSLYLKDMGNFHEKINDEVGTSDSKKLDEVRYDKFNLNLMDSIQAKGSNISINGNVEVKEAALSDTNIVKINDSIIQLVETTNEGETSVLKVKLYPEELGTVDVTLKMEDGKLTAKILVDSEQVKGMFTKSINELNEGLLKQNIQIEKINIDLNLNTSSNNMNHGFDFNQHGSFNQGSHFMRSNFRHSYFSTENIVSENTDIHMTGELSILA